MEFTMLDLEIVFGVLDILVDAALGVGVVLILDFYLQVEWRLTLESDWNDFFAF